MARSIEATHHKQCMCSLGRLPLPWSVGGLPASLDRENCMCAIGTLPVHQKLVDQSYRPRAHCARWGVANIYRP